MADLQEMSPTPVLPLLDLGWLVRYALHCGLPMPAGQPPEQALRTAFGAPAWRIVCRSPKVCFLPILRNQELSIHSLIAYCKRLADRSFVIAPQAILLEFFVTQRRKFFDHPCRVPEDQDYELMRVADRDRSLKMADIALVANWSHQQRVDIRPQRKWSSLVRQAQAFRAHEQVQLAARDLPRWHFYCRTVSWRGYEVEPITDSAQLWIEGMAMSSCVYRLRCLCSGTAPSRFFSIKKDGKRAATLELGWIAPQKDFVGMDREWGKWCLQDLRLSFNRLPDRGLVDAMKGFAQMYNLWSKRPGRWAADERQDIRLRSERLYGQQLRLPSQDSWRGPGWVVPANYMARLLATGG